MTSLFTADLEPNPDAVARADDPETSWAAARSVGAVTEKRAAVLNVLRNFPPGLTDHQLVQLYASWHPNVPQSESGLRTRRSELVELGLVVDSGQRVRLPSRRMATVWRAT